MALKLNLKSRKQLRSSQPEVFCKDAVLKNLTNLTVSHPRWSPFLCKLSDLEFQFY